ncbi:MAG: pyruvate, phosphate dikinase, partial [Spirochaetaceae bacterium]|nr:pyruvate, phosphate dikinase [Spirochaetaceae bacterium]
RASLKAKPVPYKIGTMIELPAAALGAGEIAQYAEFFSFGTNDLTQTTLGLSRDDFNNFMPDYTMFDLIPANPFEILDSNVKELVSFAVRRGKMTRPNIKLGLCGEQGAIPVNIEFCISVGLNYVSCSTYSVPIAILAAAQIQMKNAGK